MNDVSQTCPMTRSAVVDRYFMEHRAKLIDVAAFLDRLDRATEDSSKEDFRTAALKKAITILGDNQPNRAKRMLELYSDPTTTPIDAAPMQGARGAYQSDNGEHS